LAWRGILPYANGLERVNVYCLHAAADKMCLVIVKHMIEAHKQTINLSSTPNVGTTFAFTLKKGKSVTPTMLF